MGEGPFRHRLRFLRFRRPVSRTRSTSWVNNAPRAPPIPAANRMSDASSESHDEFTSTNTRLRLPSITRTTTTSQPQQPSPPLPPPPIDLKCTRNENPEATCVICLDSLSPGMSTIVLPECGHAMWHAHCVRKWLGIASRCPLCAATIPLGNPNQLNNNNNNNINEHSNINSHSHSHSHSHSRRRSSTATRRNNNNNNNNNNNVVDESMPNHQLPWTLSERRVHERDVPAMRSGMIRRRTSTSSQDSNWVLLDRRISLAARPSRRRRVVRLPPSLSMVFR